MSKKLMFVALVGGFALYNLGKSAVGVPVDTKELMQSVYWVGATLLVSHIWGPKQ